MLNINKSYFFKNIIISFEIFMAIIAYVLVKNNFIREQIYLLEVIVLFFISSNVLIWIFLNQRDTYLLKLQKKLVAKNNINNTIFNLQKAIIVVRNDVTMTQANDTFFKTFNFNNIEDFLAKHVCVCELFISKEDVPHVLPVMEGINWTDYISSNPNKEHDAYMIDKNGNERIYSIDVKENVFDEKSMVVFTEITEIKNQMETFHNLFASSIDGLLLLQENKFLDVNSALLKMVGCENKDEFLKLTPKDLLPLTKSDSKTSLDLHKEMVTEALTVGSSIRQRIQRKLSGEEFWCEIAMTKIKINHKDTIYVRWRDIHDYKLLQFSLEDEVKRQAKVLVLNSRLSAIGEMMENITHQWKQPLSIILNLVNILKLDAPNNKELSIILDQTKYLNNTIADFKNFSSTSEEEKISFKLIDSINSTLKIFPISL